IARGDVHVAARVVVLSVDAPARKDPHAAESDLRSLVQHQELDARCVVAQQHHRGGRNRRQTGAERVEVVCVGIVAMLLRRVAHVHVASECSAGSTAPTMLKCPRSGTIVSLAPGTIDAVWRACATGTMLSASPCSTTTGQRTA